MKYVCLIYLDEEKRDFISDAECESYSQELDQNGYRLAAESLDSVLTATTIRVRNGKTSVTDGPFAETREQLGGFYLIEARDLNEAIRVASKIPAARLGSIEVRPVRALNPQLS